MSVAEERMEKVAKIEKILTVIGPDRPGIIAQVATDVAACGGNIVDIAQTVMGNSFAMMMRIEGVGAAELGSIKVDGCVVSCIDPRLCGAV